MWGGYDYGRNRNVPLVPGQQMPIKLEPIDWNLVSVLDPEIIQRIKDVDSIQKIVSNFISANFTNGCSKVLVHPLSIRLCQLLQIGFQIMETGQNELKKIVEDDERVKEKQRIQIKKLKSKLNITEEKLKIKSIPYDKCPVCGKKFKSLDYVDKHIHTKHNELWDCWDCMRGRKKPTKEPELQVVLDEIERLKTSIKRQKEDRNNHKEEVPAYVQQNVDIFNQNNNDINDEQSEIAHNELDAAVNSLEQSINKWNEQKESADNQFNIFNRPPSSFVPQNMNRPFFVNNEDLLNNDDGHVELFQPLKEEEIDTSQAPSILMLIEEEEEEVNEISSIGLPNVEFKCKPEEPKRLFNNSKEKKRIIKKAQKVLYKPESSILETAKKSQIEDAIDLVKKKESEGVKKYLNDFNGENVMPSYVRSSIGLNDPDYNDLRNYIQSKLEDEYPLENSKETAPKVDNIDLSNQIKFDLIRTGQISANLRKEPPSMLEGTISLESDDDDSILERDSFKSELPSFSYESVESSTLTDNIKPVLNFEHPEENNDVSINESVVDIAPEQNVIVSIPENDVDVAPEKDIVSSISNNSADIIPEQNVIVTIPDNKVDIVPEQNVVVSVYESSVSVSPDSSVKAEEEASVKDDDEKSIHEYTYEYYSDSESSFHSQKEANDDEIHIEQFDDNNTSATVIKQDSLGINDALFSPIVKPKIPVNNKVDDSIIESPIEELNSITKSPSRNNSIGSPRKHFMNTSHSPSKRNSSIRQNIVLSPSKSRVKMDKDNFLMSPPPVKIKKHPFSISDQSLSTTEEQSSELDKVTPSISAINEVEDSDFAPKPNFDDFTFEEVPKEDISLSRVSPSKKNAAPRVSLSPSAMSPVKRKMVIMIGDIPVEPSSDLSIDSLSDINGEGLAISFNEPSEQPKEESMVEGSFDDNYVIQSSSNVSQIDSEISNISVKKPSKRNDSTLRRSTPKKRKSSPRRKQDSYHDSFYSVESSKNKLSEGEDEDGGFDITEELKKLDEDVKKNEIGASFLKKSPNRKERKSRLSKRAKEEPSSFLLNNRVSIFSDDTQSKNTESDFSIIPRSVKNDDSSEQNVSLLDGAKHLERRSKKNDQFSFNYQ